jgi:hypothetical protein
MRSIREYYERNFTPASTRNESYTGPLQDLVGRIFERMQNEECSLAHLVRAVSILRWLVNVLEPNVISLDRQTREEVEICAIGLTKEYIQRGGYVHQRIAWALEWASTRTITEIVPQVLHALKEGPRARDWSRDQFLEGLEQLHRHHSGQEAREEEAREDLQGLTVLRPDAVYIRPNEVLLNFVRLALDKAID